MDVVRTLLFALCMTSFANVLSQETSPVQYPFDHPDSNPRGIFGTDGRKEIKDTEGFSEFARATAVLIPKEDLKGNRVYGYSLRDVLSAQYDTDKFDDNVKFLDQISTAGCSGFLIAPDVLVTAGHCFSNIEEAKEWVWLFDYTNDLKYINERKGYIEIDTANIYTVKEVLISKLERNDDASVDYAVLQLDRKSDRRPYRFRSSGTVANGTDVYTIGSPNGLPLKLSTESTVIDNTASTWFKSDIDSFPGSSGGPIFDSNGFIEGILVRGAVEYSNGRYTGDYKYEEECDCVKTVTFEEVGYTSGCQGHKITDLPKELTHKSIYDNLEYAITNNLSDRYDDWAIYHWIFLSDYTKNRGRLEEIAINTKNYRALEHMIYTHNENYTDDYVRKLLDIAVSTDNQELLDILLNNELDPDAGYNSTLKLIQVLVKSNKTSTVQQFIDAGSLLDVVDSKGNTLLHYAASNGNSELVKMLLDNNVNPDIKNISGDYPEESAEKGGHKDLMKILRKVRKKAK